MFESWEGVLKSWHFSWVLKDEQVFPHHIERKGDPRL
jgi:hypothetical protein